MIPNKNIVPSYREAINYILEPYASDDKIIKTDEAIVHFSHLSNKLPLTTSRLFGTEQGDRTEFNTSTYLKTFPFRDYHSTYVTA